MLLFANRFRLQDEIDKVWKETSVACLGLPGVCPELHKPTQIPEGDCPALQILSPAPALAATPIATLAHTMNALDPAFSVPWYFIVLKGLRRG